MKLYQKQFGLIKFNEPFTAILKAIRSNEPNRYALNRIEITEAGFTVTDGRRLFHCENSKHGLHSGLYYLTEDGFPLLDEAAGDMYPKWSESVPDDTEMKEIYAKSCLGDTTQHTVIYHLNHADVNFHIGWMLELLGLLEKLDAGPLSVSVHKTEPGKRPFVIRGTIQGGEFTYIQMPISL